MTTVAPRAHEIQSEKLQIWGKPGIHDDVFKTKLFQTLQTINLSADLYSISPVFCQVTIDPIPIQSYETVNKANPQTC